MNLKKTQFCNKKRKNLKSDPSNQENKQFTIRAVIVILDLNLIILDLKLAVEIYGLFYLTWCIYSGNISVRR